MKPNKMKRQKPFSQLNAFQKGKVCFLHPDRDDVPKLESYRKRLKGSKLILFTRGVDEAAEELLRAA